MSEIKLLDCTLRDGGYVNNWEFGERGTPAILDALVASRVDCIEVGFLTTEEGVPGRTRFPTAEKMMAAFPKSPSGSCLTFGMIVFGKYPIERLNPQSETGLDGIRVTFKKNERDEALEYCRKIQELGYLVSVNPTGADAYNDREFIEIVELVNEMRPFALAIVDTLGAMKRRDVKRLCMLIDHNLHPDIALCFHSHNNLQLSFANALEVMSIQSSRTFIIDTCVFGMGRGAGNLCTELMMRHLNERVPNRYELIPILQIIDERINRFFAKTPWGYSVPYYLAAVNRCHPNYASFLLGKQTLSVTEIDILLKMIPSDLRNEYSKSVIEELYLKYQAHAIDDSAARDKLRKMLAGREVLVVAPGKSLISKEQEIRQFVERNNPFIIAVNVLPPNFSADAVFVSNAKRFAELKTDSSVQVIQTSNIPDSPTSLCVNYSSYLNDSELLDNASLMLLELLIRVGTDRVAVAGLDGFSVESDENYFSQMLENPARRVGVEDPRNTVMQEQLARFARRITIDWLTPSRYNVH